jgi:hypothetical protein
MVVQEVIHMEEAVEVVICSEAEVVQEVIHSETEVVEGTMMGLVILEINSWLKRVIIRNVSVWPRSRRIYETQR